MENELLPLLWYLFARCHFVACDQMKRGLPDENDEASMREVIIIMKLTFFCGWE